MKQLAAAAFVLATTPLLAQQTGVAHPADAIDEVPATVAVPSSIPVVAAPVMVVAPAQPMAAADPLQDSSPAVTLRRHDLAKFTPDATAALDADPDSGIVVGTPARSGELQAGTVLRARLRSAITTAGTAPETPFTATLSEPVVQMGRTIFPAGSTLEGRVTEIHGGRRLHGAAMIHLQAQFIVLPDGTRLPLNAAVIDTDQYAQTRIDGEGNIVRKDHALQTLAEFSLATGSGAAAGGVFGGAPGALVGAGIGAGVGTAVWLKQDREATLPSETLVVLVLTAPMPIEPRTHTPELVMGVPAPSEVDLPADGSAPRFSQTTALSR